MRVYIRIVMKMVFLVNFAISKSWLLRDVPAMKLAFRTFGPLLMRRLITRLITY
jgi:hypothetical protein